VRRGATGTSFARVARTMTSRPSVLARVTLVAALAGSKLYVAAMPDVAVVDVARGVVTKRIPVEKGPWGVAICGGKR
jgi:YVTN family beta-propeller protein